MNVDRMTIKVRALQEIEHKLELGEDVDIHIVGSVVKEEVGDNQDGSVNICYIVKPMSTVVTKRDHDT